MPRRGTVGRREISPDAVYKSELVSRLINKFMRQGKKALAQRLVYGALDGIGEKTGKPPLQVLEAAMKNIMPLLEVRPRRVGGATYQVPVEVRPERRVSLGLRWLVGMARSRGERGMQARIMGEIVDAAGGTGGAVKKREDTHRMAEANKAFAHYRW